MTYTDAQLKQVLAKMLPKIKAIQHLDEVELAWKTAAAHVLFVRDTEYLHICWLVEETFSGDVKTFTRYIRILLGGHGEPLGELPTNSDMWNVTHATWQQRTIALAKVKHVDVV